MIFNLSKTALYGSTTLALSVVLSTSTALAATSGCISGDCTGYTQTAEQCAGKAAIRCLYDSSKYFCISDDPACDDSYKYTCTGSNEKPSGDSCGGKYKECSCTKGEWADGDCATGEIEFCVASSAYGNPPNPVPTNMEAYILQGDQKTFAKLPSYWGDKSCVTVKLYSTEPAKLVYDFAAPIPMVPDSEYQAVSVYIYYANFPYTECGPQVESSESTLSYITFTLASDYRVYRVHLGHIIDDTEYTRFLVKSCASTEDGNRFVYRK